MADKANEKTAEGINLIVPESVAVPSAIKDRKGGETHSIRSSVGDFVKRWTSKTIPEDVLQQNLQKCMHQLRDLLKQAPRKTLEGWDVEEISISLAISAEGSVGIATAGAETSIEVTFKRISKAPENGAS